MWPRLEVAALAADPSARIGEERVSTRFDVLLGAVVHFRGRRDSGDKGEGGLRSGDARAAMGFDGAASAGGNGGKSAEFAVLLGQMARLGGRGLGSSPTTWSA